MTSHSNTAPTRFVEADGTRFAYRRFGDPIGTPIVLLQHFMGNLDNYDPAITDALAMGREVILTDNAGVGLSTGDGAGDRRRDGAGRGFAHRRAQPRAGRSLRLLDGGTRRPADRGRPT